MSKNKKNDLFKILPSVTKILQKLSIDKRYKKIPKVILVNYIRSSLNYLRYLILNRRNNMFLDKVLILEFIIEFINKKILEINSIKLRKVINATGVILHTNLGRAPLAEDVIRKLSIIAGNYSNLEYNISSGYRGNRFLGVELILSNIIGSEGVLVVNNNAAAILICLDEFANSKEIIISRSELVEIGGSFRIPDIINKSGAFLKEVGTTNKTYIEDYSKAVTEKTALILKVHTSNYSIVGFTSSVILSDLVKLGKDNSIIIMEDLGSGALVDFSKYSSFYERTLQESFKSGVDLITFSGDKLLGGPQAGIIVGKKKYIDKIKKNPLMRVLRVDKITLSSLEYTLKLYFNEKNAIKKIPVLKMILNDINSINKKALKLKNEIDIIFKRYKRSINLEVYDMFSIVGGGSLPLVKIPTKCLKIRIDGLKVNKISEFLRNCSIPVIGRIENNYYILDLRTVKKLDIELIVQGFEKLVQSLFNY